MSESHLMQQSADKRTCDRINFNRKILVELKDGSKLECITKNISLGGVLVQSAQDTSHCRLGQEAKLFLVNSATSSDAYHCKIVRVADELLGLKIDRKAAAKFGKELTKGMFMRK